jgi:peptide deformylase
MNLNRVKVMEEIKPFEPLEPFEPLVIGSPGNFNINPLVGETSDIPTVYPLIGEKDPILHQKIERFDFDNPPINPVILYRNMGRSLIEYNGLGLAAPQVGLSYRFFVMRAEKIIGVFNPIIVDKSDKEIILEEGCLSYDLLFIKVKRPETIRVRYTTPDGVTSTHTLGGMTARVFQHEYDHLEGITYHNRANKLHLEMALKKRKKIRSGKLRVIQNG